MWNNKKVSVVISLYRENAIKSVIEDFFSSPNVDEVIVVDNNTSLELIKEVKKTKAVLITERKQGQGWGLRKGMEVAKGDYVILCEGDGSFKGVDVDKFLVYANDFSAVFGTRTNKSLLEPGAMLYPIHPIRRLADVFEGKVIEFLFRANTLSDVGCTYKLLTREVIKKLQNKWITGDSHFVTEITLQVAAAGIPFIEIPIAFRKRVDKSAVTGNIIKIVKWGIKLLYFILWFWVRWLFSGKDKK